MGQKSDREYHGKDDPNDWNTGKKKYVAISPPSIGMIAAKKAKEEAINKNEPRLERIKIARDQLPRFREKGEDYAREYGGEVYATILRRSQENGLMFTLFTDAGLALEAIRCSSNSFPEYKNLREFY